MYYPGASGAEPGTPSDATEFDLQTERPGACRHGLVSPAPRLRTRSPTSICSVGWKSCVTSAFQGAAGKLRIAAFVADIGLSDQSSLIARKPSSMAPPLELPPLRLADLKVTASFDYVKAYCLVRYTAAFSDNERTRWTRVGDSCDGWCLTFHDPSPRDIVNIAVQLLDPAIWGFELSVDFWPADHVPIEDRSAVLAQTYRALAGRFRPDDELLFGAGMATLPPKELQRIYIALGRALWHVQYVEDALHALLTVKHDIGGPGRFTEKEARAMLTKRLRSTMGPAVKLARELHLLPGDDLDRLARLKSERDWVAHKVQRTVGDEVLSPWGRLDLTRRLDSITAESQAVLATLTAEMRRFVESTGHEVVVPARFHALVEADRASGA